MMHFTNTVGVAPGTTTMQLAGTNVRLWNTLSQQPLGAIDTRARIRWDIIGLIGGIALITATLTGLIASSLGK